MSSESCRLQMLLDGCLGSLTSCSRNTPPQKSKSKKLIWRVVVQTGKSYSQCEIKKRLPIPTWALRRNIAFVVVNCDIC